MKILGIDPAPAKESIIFDGKEFFSKKPFELKDFLEEKTKNSPYIIGWDAPLGDDFSKSLSQKPIEKILNNKSNYINEQKPPKGISTLPFSTCPHWSISQFTLGYPIVNYEIIDKSKLKYNLVQSKSDISQTKPNVVEVHPAYTMWVWLKDNITEFKYKGSKESKANFKKIVRELFKLKIAKKYKNIEDLIINDDYLDSFVAYLIIEEFLQSRAFIYGNKESGAMLLPPLNDIIKEKTIKILTNSR